MNQKTNQGGRSPKVHPATHHYVVRLNDIENNAFLTMFEKSSAINKATFIKNILLSKPFKVFVVDENTRIFIDKLSSLNAQYRSIGIEYNTLVKTLSDNYSEKKALKALYKLEQATIDLVKLNRQIVVLANDFDVYWRAPESE